MEKKVFIPTMDELYLMQDMGGDMYKYLLAKAIETIVATNSKFTDREILKNIKEEIRENPDIARAICLMFPQEIANIEVAQYDLNLCSRLIEPINQQNIANLDILSSFSTSIQDNPIIIKKVTRLLTLLLKENPRYRFTYKDSKLLDDIFLRKIIEDYQLNKETASNLKSIEPAYVLCINKAFFEKEPKIELQKDIKTYANRYMIEESSGEEYIGKDILTTKPDEVKKLIKCINKFRKVVYK